jgi:SAM-dependent methyltransferase
MLEVARATRRPRFPGRVAFVRADAAAPPFGAAADVVFSTTTFHWVLDHDALFRGVFATLRPGGRLVAQAGGGPNLARLLARATALVESRPFARSSTGGASRGGSRRPTRRRSPRGCRVRGRRDLDPPGAGDRHGAGRTSLRLRAPPHRAATDRDAGLPSRPCRLRP